MKFVFVFLGLLALVLSNPIRRYQNQNPDYHHNSGHGHGHHDDSRSAKIIQQDYINAGTGYNFVYQTSDGTTREEKAEFRNPGTKDETLVVHGSYSYVGADGNTYTITYVADENGYRPTGQHIPAL